MTVPSTRIEDLYRDRAVRARELKAGGEKIVGYLCSLTPVELITAAGLVPYRILGGRNEPITVADQHLEVIACPFTRSILDMVLKGKYDFLDGFVSPHACDNIVKLYDIVGHNADHRYAHFINVPHTLSAPSFKFFEAELALFRRSLERYTGGEISDDAIREAVALHGAQRQLVRHLYGLRRIDPPLISGGEMIKAMLAVVSLPAAEANSLLQELISEVNARESTRGRSRARLMITGAGNDDATFVEAIEELGANVVVDDLCIGTKPYWYDVDLTARPLAGLARCYLDKVNCPRTYRESPGTHQADLENRFGYIRRLAHEFEVDGVIAYRLIYCDTHALDAPDLKEYLRSQGLPVLFIEEGYPTVSLGKLRTQAQAFLETMA